MEKNKQEPQITAKNTSISQEDLLINLYFMFMDAGDILLRRAVSMVENKYKSNKGLSGEVKMYHNRMMQNAKMLRMNYDAYYERTHIEAFSKDYDRMDDLRNEANMMIRIALLLTDRSYLNPKVDSIVEKYISAFPKGDLIIDDLIEFFKLR